MVEKSPLGKDAAVIGEVIDDSKGKLYIKTELGGTRILKPLEGEIFPRIC